MKTVELTCGAVLEVDEGIFDDMEMLDRLIAFERGDYAELPDLVRAVLGDQKQVLYDALRDERGRVPTKAFGEAFGELLQEVLPKKS